MRVLPASDTLCLVVRGIEAEGRDATRLGSREPNAAHVARAEGGNRIADHHDQCAERMVSFRFMNNIIGLRQNRRAQQSDEPLGSGGRRRLALVEMLEPAWPKSAPHFFKINAHAEPGRFERDQLFRLRCGLVREAGAPDKSNLDVTKRAIEPLLERPRRAEAKHWLIFRPWQKVGLRSTNWRTGSVLSRLGILLCRYSPPELLPSRQL